MVEEHYLDRKISSTGVTSRKHDRWGKLDYKLLEHIAHQTVQRTDTKRDCFNGVEVHFKNSDSK